MNTKVDRYNLILKNKDYIKYQKENDNCESNRIFCRHNMQHALDVARIAYIINLEDSYGIEKDIIYATALLHDIGKWKQYKDGTPHNLSGADIARVILQTCGYRNLEIDLITSAIIKHCGVVEKSKSLEYLLYFSDKKSRNCFECHSIEHCKWNDSKKNHDILF